MSFNCSCSFMARNVEDELEDYVWGRSKESEYLERVVRSDGLAIDSILKKVSQIDDTLNRQLRKGVEENLSRLLEQTTALEALDRTQRGVHSEMKEVFEGCDKFSSNLDHLLKDCRENTVNLEKYTKIRNIVSDASRCEDLMDSFEKRSELVKRSEIVCEVRGIVEDNPPLLQISWLKETITSKLRAAENEVRRAAADDLRRALASLNASLVASATKAMANLGVLDAELEVQLSSAATEVDTKLCDLAQSSDSARLLPLCINLIHSQLEQCVMLGNAYISKFTEKLARIIRARVPLDAPFTLRLVQQMGRVLQSRPECSLGPLEDALRPLKASLLSHSLNRLHGIIEEHDFTAGHATAFVDVLNSAIEEELAKTEFDIDLRDEMQRNIRKSIDMVAKRFEIETKLEPEHLLFGDRINAVQLTNYRLLQSAHSLASRWPAHAEPLNTYQSDVIETFMKSVRVSVATILSTMHRETLNGKEVSPYMQELSAYLGRVLLHASHMGAALQQSVALPTLSDFVIDNFLLHTTLVRPITASIRHQQRIDYDRLIHALDEFGLGSRYTDTMSLACLFSEDKSWITSSVPGVPTWAMIHVLITDSPSSLVSPHTSVDWTIEQYVVWCSDRSNQERLTFLNNLISSYASSVVSRGETEYVSHYPAILKILQAGILM